MNKLYSKTAMTIYRALTLICLVLFFAASIWLLIYRLKLAPLAPIYIFDASTDIVGIMVCMVMVVSVLMGMRGAFSISQRNSSLFLLLTFVESCLLILDEYTWFVMGFSNMLFMSRLSNALFLIACGAFVTVWWHYVVANSKDKLTWFKPLSKAINIAFCLYCLMSLVNIFDVHLVFAINPDGSYERCFGIFICYAFIFLVLGAIALALLCQRSLNKRDRILLLILILVPALATVVLALVFSLSTSYVGTLFVLILLFADMFVKRGRQLAEQERKLAEQQSNIMLSQIQPHFLYNSLSAIMGIEGNPPETIDALAYFSHYLRENLSTLNSANLVSFTRELEHVKSYLYLEKLRFGDRLTVEFGINATEFSIPPLTVQILAENAVKHGITARDGGGTLVIASREEENAFLICVEDDGVGFDVQNALNLDDSHIGLSNVMERVQSACNGTIDIKSTIDKGTRVIVTIPKEV